jgi:hypothetical protein
MNIFKRITFVLMTLIVFVFLLGSADTVMDRASEREKGNAQGVGGSDKVTICHKTGSSNNPYVELHLPASALKNGHGKHEGDIIPAPEGGCPK